MDYDAIIELLIGHGYILSDDKERATILLRKANYPEPSESAKGEADERNQLQLAWLQARETQPQAASYPEYLEGIILAARRPSAEPAKDARELAEAIYKIPAMDDPEDQWILSYADKAVPLIEAHGAALMARAEKAEAKAKQWHEAYDRELDDIATVRSEL